MGKYRRVARRPVRTKSQGLSGITPRSGNHLPNALLTRIAEDTLFHITTRDNSVWIEPFTGQALFTNGSTSETAIAFYRHNDVWDGLQPLGQEQLNILRWRQELQLCLPHEPRLRLFCSKSGAWLNPFTSELNPWVMREEGEITSQTISKMAHTLAACPAAQWWGMKSMDALMKLTKGSERVSTERIKRDSSPVVRQVSDVPNRQDKAQNDEHDLDKAAAYQRRLLPNLPENAPFDMAIHLRQWAKVGGDFYDVIPLYDGSYLVVLGDVSGHGVQAAMVMATTLTTLRMLARQYSGLSSLIAQLNDEIKQELGSGQFITLSAAIVDADGLHCEMVLAGHHHFLLVDSSSKTVIQRVGEMGMAVGLLTGERFRATLRAQTIELLPGQLLIQYSDGLSEGLASNGEEYGLHRLMGSCLNRSQQPLQDMVDGIIADSLAYSEGKQEDDLCVLALRIERV